MLEVALALTTIGATGAGLADGPICPNKLCVDNDEAMKLNITSDALIVFILGFIMSMFLYLKRLASLKARPLWFLIFQRSKRLNQDEFLACVLADVAETGIAGALYAALCVIC